MTSTAAPVNVTYDSVDYTDIDGIFLYQIRRGGPGELPEVSGVDDVIPGADGVFPRNRRKRTRTIELFGWVRGIASSESTDRDDYWANRVALETAFTPALTTGKVLAIDTGSASKSIDVKPVAVDFNEIHPSFAEVSIVLVSTEPDWA